VGLRASWIPPFVQARQVWFVCAGAIAAIKCASVSRNGVALHLRFVHEPVMVRDPDDDWICFCEG
jgi:hypothetical protein